MIVTKKSHWNCLRPKNMILLDDLEQIIERVCPSNAYEQNHLWDRMWRLLFYNKIKNNCNLKKTRENNFFCEINTTARKF